MTHGKYLQKLAEISLGWSDKPVPNNLLSLSIAFWVVRKLSIQFGLRDSKHVGFFIRGDNTYICINICKWECSVDLLKSPKITMFILNWVFVNNCTNCFHHGTVIWTGITCKKISSQKSIELGMVLK